jgi:hypothetical protein
MIYVEVQHKSGFKSKKPSSPPKQAQRFLVEWAAISKYPFINDTTNYQEKLTLFTNSISNSQYVCHINILFLLYFPDFIMVYPDLK